MKKNTLPLLALLLVAPTFLTMAGCGANNDPVKEDPKVTEQRVDSAKQMRSYFDKSGGNYDALTADDKAALDKMTGGPDKSKEAFGHMGVPSGAGATGGGLPPSR